MQCNKKLLVLFLLLVVSLYLYLSSSLYSHKEKEDFSYGSTQRLKKKKYQSINFNKDGNDVFSFVHIQKTGGTTFEKHLVQNIKNGNCKCDPESRKPSCMCYRINSSEIWLINRYIQPKWPCGLHPDLTTLKECTPDFMNNQYGEKKRRYLYGTILRDPVMRYLSEFRNMQRGASWVGAASLCQGKSMLEELTPCYESKIWHDITLKKFISCPTNLAHNRQTWMLSNISAVGCDFDKIMKDPIRSAKLLRIAKRNIEKISYFALLEYPKESQFIFEMTFGLKFIIPFIKWDTGFANEYLKSFERDPGEVLENKIKDINDLDVILYDFAKKIFFERYKYFVETFGEPKYHFPTGTVSAKFSRENKYPIERLKENKPKSLAKELRMKRKRENDLEQLRQKRRISQASS